MKFGLHLPQREGVDIRHDVVETARTAEGAGYDSLWTWERLLYPLEPLSPFTLGGAWPDFYRQAAAPLPLLAAAAVVTSKVRLGTSVIVAALHGPVQLAKNLATLDQLSGGRLVAGLGTGWSTDEFIAVGATNAERGRRLDEMLDVFDAVWGPDPVNYAGPNAAIENSLFLPKPTTKIPVMLGGGTAELGRRTRQPQAITRVAERADGWLPQFTTPGPEAAATLRSEWDQIRELATSFGRDPSQMEMVVIGNVGFSDQPVGAERDAFTGSIDQVMEDVASVKEAGADELILDLNLQDWWRETEQMLEAAVEIRERAWADGL